LWILLRIIQPIGGLSCLLGTQRVSSLLFDHLLFFISFTKTRRLTTDLPSMALPPCHMFCQFYVTLPTTPGSKPKLSCLMYQRSCDLGLGVPFNIASYALLTHMIAYMTDTEPHEFILQMGDAHVYKDHVEPLREQLKREPREFPKLKWARGKEEIGDIDGFKLEDFVVEGYKPMGKIEMKMSVSQRVRAEPER
jgi:thymidylate synthase